MLEYVVRVVNETNKRKTGAGGPSIPAAQDRGPHPDVDGYPRSSKPAYESGLHGLERANTHGAASTAPAGL